MKKFLWFVIGIGAGFAIAHQVAKTPEGSRFFEGVDSKARQFGAALLDGYKSREAELRGAVAEAESAIADLAKRAK
ncbi:hypothetical protein [Galbitalea soli]|uniref:YtxH domain-containing protein n=1 Tax=Galbitalea soli TaxID=1268042 RepID=A0A7C9PLH9_9MICO|nr:hypothetical protein [Galbitalea soli]NEM90225.1 hypothetical protein [Galbitalea soli]NYJ30933.1 hypothetical protein [Galbitalea soli]